MRMYRTLGGMCLEPRLFLTRLTPFLFFVIKCAIFTDISHFIWLNMVSTRNYLLAKIIISIMNGSRTTFQPIVRNCITTRYCLRLYRKQAIFSVLVCMLHICSRPSSFSIHQLHLLLQTPAEYGMADRQLDNMHMNQDYAVRL